MQVNGDNVFRPEIVRAVNLIEYKVEKLKQNDNAVTNKLEQAKEQLRDATNGRTRRNR